METCRTKRPSRVYIDLTNACTLACPHCCTGSGSPADDELSLAEIEDLVDQVHAMGVGQLVFSGGEPMLRPELPQILAHSRQRQLSVTILTNGLAIDATWASFFATHDIRVKVSLDGVCGSTHDFIRGAGAFERTIESLAHLRERGGERRCVHFTAPRRNVAELTELPRFLSAVGVEQLVVGLIKPAGRARENAELLIPPVMAPYVRQKIDTIAHDPRITLGHFTDRGWEGFGCPATCNKLGVTASGRMTTCVFLGDDLLGGSVREHSLAELWAHHLGRDAFSVNPECARCPNLARSGGGCRANAIHFRGDRDAVDPYCCAYYGKQLFIEGNRPLLETAQRSAASW